MEAGCDRVLAKPCSPALLVATIKSLMAESRQGSAAASQEPLQEHQIQPAVELETHFPKVCNALKTQALVKAE